MRQFFHSDKKSIREERLPPGFSDLFPFGGIHSKTGSLLSRSDPNASNLIALERGAVSLGQLAGIVLAWMKTLELNSMTGVSVGLYRKTSKENLSLLKDPSQLLISLSVTVKPVTKDKKSIRNFFIPTQSVDGISEAVASSYSLSHDLCEHLDDLKIKASVISGIDELLFRAVSMVTPGVVDGELKKRIVQALDGGKELQDIFAAEMMASPQRSFWKHGDYARMLFNLRSPSGVSEGERLERMLSTDTSGVPGTHSWHIAKSGSEEDQAVWIVQTFTADSPWKKIGEDFGTMRETASVLKVEREAEVDLMSVSSGGDWHLVESVWPEQIFLLIPGATRIDDQSVRTLFDATELNSQ